jgi:outer membrane biosynthesis protein TonB
MMMKMFSHIGEIVEKPVEEYIQETNEAPLEKPNPTTTLQINKHIKRKKIKKKITKTLTQMKTIKKSNIRNAKTKDFH